MARDLTAIRGKSMSQEEALLDLKGEMGEVKQAIRDLTKELRDNGQPGFITKTNTRLTALENADMKRGWMEHLITVVIAFAVSYGHGIYKWVKG